MRVSVLQQLTRSACRVGAVQPTARTFNLSAAHFSSSQPRQQDVSLKPNVKDGIAVIEMNRKPVNGLSLEFNTEFTIALDKLENDKSCRGLVLTSTQPVFSAGLDLTELYQPSDDRLGTFWRSFTELVMRIYSSPLPIISALNGASPAAGCALACATDYRIMAEGKHTIGLNETALGLVAPAWLQKLFVQTVGSREAEWGLQLGYLYTPQEALKVGLIDKVVPKEQLMEVTMAEMAKWTAVSPTARQITKQMLRQPWLDEFHRRRKEDDDMFISLVKRESTQNMIGRYLEALKKKG